METRKNQVTEEDWVPKSKYQVSGTTDWLLACISDADKLYSQFRDAVEEYFGKCTENVMASFDESFSEMRGAMFEIMCEVISEKLQDGNGQI